MAELFWVLGISLSTSFLCSILEAVLLDTMYDLPSTESVTKVVIDESVIKGESDPMLMYENVDKAQASPQE